MKGTVSASIGYIRIIFFKKDLARKRGERRRSFSDVFRKVRYCGAVASFRDLSAKLCVATEFT